MRPIKLTMQAFGPYKESEEIDFTKLGNRHLFLICGKTGSGKSTLFDAICFSLYQETGTGEKNIKELRSQFADEGLLTKVSFVFELRGEKYRVERIPPQLKRKSRGEGFTEQKSEASLHFLSKEKEPITGVVAVSREIESLIGLNKDQFSQIMMIPQGEFKKLLVADSEARASILSRLFKTNLYKAFQEELQLREKNKKKIIDEMKSTCETDVRRIRIDVEEEKLIELQKSDNRDINLFLKLLDEMVINDKNRLDREKEQISIDEKKIEKLIREIEKGKKDNELLNERDENRKNYQELLEQKPIFEDRDKKLKTAKLASTIIPYETRYRDEKKQHKSLSEEKSKLNKKAISLKKEKEKAEEKYNELNSEDNIKKIDKIKIDIEKTNDQLKRLDKKTELEAKLSVIKEDIDKENRLKLDKKETIESLGNEIKEIESLKDDYFKKHNELNVLKGKKEQYLKDEKCFNKIRECKIELEKKQKHLIEVASMFNEASKMYDNEVLNHRQLQLSYHKNMAALIAKELKDGQACPVCGSLEHPLIARVQGKSITKKDLDLHQKKVDKKAKDKDEIQTNKLKIENEISNITQRIEDQRLQISYEADFKNHEVKKKEILDAVLETSKWLKEAKKVLDKEVNIKEKLDKIKKELEEIEININRKSNEKASLEGLIDDIEATLGDGIKDKESVLKKRNELVDKNAKMIKELDKARMKSQELKTDFEKVSIELSITKDQIDKSYESKLKYKEELIQKAKECGFEDSSKYLEAKLDEDTILKEEKAINAYKETFSYSKKRMAELNETTKTLKKVDLNELDDKREKLSKELNIKREGLGNLNSKIDNNKYLHSSLITQLKDIEKHEKEYAYTASISKIANGVNKRGITFERYVLAAFLEEILFYANGRLKKMTNGRYQMRITKERERINKQSGLDLEVFDFYTGMERHVKTLSGGESFKASLAMALGLSEVVESYAGGVRLDTMFVDEGFGSLDQESLDSAINTLIELQDSGRLVGIISHVSELKERIEARLEVIKTSNGSYTKFAGF